ncbi:hypothetical protein [Streptomyces sp. NPDC053069]|uniref:hypothetical protein n=1 Tax=Streptomyces sp. NPDC053069 TaxID=3365695 RepID=UPI0037D74774
MCACQESRDDEDLGRWLGLAMGQADKGFPLELLAAVGQTLALEPSMSGPS